MPKAEQLPSEGDRPPQGVQLPADKPGDKPGAHPDNTLPDAPRVSPRHAAGIEGPDQPLPTDLKAGMMVVYHLPKDFCPNADKDYNFHRAALINSVYATEVEAEPKKKSGAPRHDVPATPDTPDSGPTTPPPATKEAHLDLTVFLCAGDDPGRTFPLLLVPDAQYDSECPPGSFCLESDGDDLPTVGDVTAEVNPLTEKKKTSDKGLTSGR